VLGFGNILLNSIPVKAGRAETANSLRPTVSGSRLTEYSLRFTDNGSRLALMTGEMPLASARRG